MRERTVQSSDRVRGKNEETLTVETKYRNKSTRSEGLVLRNTGFGLSIQLDGHALTPDSLSFEDRGMQVVLQRDTVKHDVIPWLEKRDWADFSNEQLQQLMAQVDELRQEERRLHNEWYAAQQETRDAAKIARNPEEAGAKLMEEAQNRAREAGFDLNSPLVKASLVGEVTEGLEGLIGEVEEASTAEDAALEARNNQINRIKEQVGEVAAEHVGALVILAGNPDAFKNREFTEGEQAITVDTYGSDQVAIRGLNNTLAVVSFDATGLFIEALKEHSEKKSIWS